jgi:hypothetical protein
VLISECASIDIMVTTITSACIRRSYRYFFTSAFSFSASVPSSAMQNT